MQTALIIIFGLAAVSFWALYRFSLRIRVNQNAYIVYLLLNDEIREGQKKEFRAYLAEAKPRTTDARDLTTLALEAIGETVNQLAQTGSPLKAHAMIWNFDQPSGSDQVTDG